MKKLRTQGKDREIYINEDGKIQVVYDNNHPAAGPFLYDDVDDFQADLEMFIEFGRKIGVLQSQHVVVV